ncbi:MAG TPA: glycosyltransferase family 4 protein [Armatimonadota bacterium]|nr:glycosyltransferase family 4 protein [Armatimonadota bacterium]
MKVLLICQHYLPEEVGIGFQIHQLAECLQNHGHSVSVLTAFPNYPKRIIFDGYKHKIFQRETNKGINVIRTWVYANPKETFASRLMNWGSFCISAMLGTAIAAEKPDIIHVLLPPLPLGATINLVGKLRRIPVVVHVQDIYPLIAIELGILRNKMLIRFFENMERRVYQDSTHIVVISQGFKDNLISKGVPPDKISVVPNWVDAGFIQPGSKKNTFRSQLGADGKFLVVYSGGLTRNSNLEPVIQAASLLKNEPFMFALVGDGPLKPHLQSLASDLSLDNLQFIPFQPLARYPEVLSAADMTLVALNKAATFASVPSKVFKQMAAGRPVLAITAKGSELEQLVERSGCGLHVPTDDPQSLADALRWAACHLDNIDAMGCNGRMHLEKKHCKEKCAGSIEAILKKTVESWRSKTLPDDSSGWKTRSDNA